jgi:hypothetical protein
MPHVGTNVDESTKARWSEYLEESECESWSELLRQAVNEKMMRDGGQDVPEEIESRMDELNELQQTLKRQMSDLSDDFETVQEQAIDQRYPEGVIELANDLAGEIEEVHRDWFEEGEQETARDWNKFRQRHCPEASRSEVIQAFEYLEENLSYIETPSNGPDDYFRLTGGQ